MFAQPDPPPAPGLNERRMALVKEVWHRMFSLSFNPESEVLGMSVRSVEAVKLASDMDAERAAYGLSNGVELSWSVPERAKAQGPRAREHHAQTAVGRCRVGEGCAQGDRAGKLLGPERRRAAVRHLQRVLGVSQRFACRVTGQHRATQRHEPERNNP